MTKLTTQIVEDNILFRKWLWRDLYEALEQAGIFAEIDKVLKEHENDVLYGTGEGEPVGILRARE